MFLGHLYGCVGVWVWVCVPSKDGSRNREQLFLCVNGIRDEHLLLTVHAPISDTMMNYYQWTRRREKVGEQHTFGLLPLRHPSLIRMRLDLKVKGIIIK